MATNQRDHHPSPRFRKATTYVSLVLLGAGATFGGNYFASRSALPVQAQIPAPQRAVPTAGINPNSNFITNVVDSVGPAVVRINSSRTVKANVPDAFNDPTFREFFGDRIPTPRSEQIQRGTGSGFIISANGEVLTNAHVVEGADTVTVKLKDGRSLQGKVMGRDPVTDVAVVKIEANNLPVVKLGNSDQLKPGEWAIAIGNPLGLDNTVTTGIISGTGRSSSDVGVPDKRVAFIQTDAAINPGNSGGPLLAANGEVIGINTAIIQGAQGLGFAIPINTAQRIATQLATTGKVEHAYLGVQMTTLTPEIKERINSNPNAPITVAEDEGVLIVQVLPNSPAAKAGIRAGDVVRKVNNQPVTEAGDLQQAVEKSQVGGNLQLELRRNGETRNLTLKPGNYPAQSE